MMPDFAPDFTIDRRALIQRMGLLLGATALPLEAFAAPARGAKRFLSAPRFKLLSALADTILPATDTPGALAAGVPATIDAMLVSWASPKTCAEAVTALDRIDLAARAQTKRRFVQLSAAGRAAFLGPYDAAALKKVPPPPGSPSANFFFRPTYVVEQGYYVIKDLVLDLYYFSELATSGDNPELIYEHVPGKFEPSVRLTPQSRPHLGTGPF